MLGVRKPRYCWFGGRLHGEGVSVVLRGRGRVLLLLMFWSWDWGRGRKWWEEIRVRQFDEGLDCLVEVLGFVYFGGSDDVGGQRCSFSPSAQPWCRNCGRTRRHSMTRTTYNYDLHIHQAKFKQYQHRQTRKKRHPSPQARTYPPHRARHLAP